MKKARSIAISLALIWILVKLVFFFIGRSAVGYEVGIFVNMLFILVTISTTLWFKYKEVKLVESTFLDDLKDTMKHAGIYIILVLSFSFIFLKVIDPDFLESKVREAVYAITEHLEEPGNFEKIKAESPSPETVTKQDIIDRTEETRRQLFSVGVTMSLSLFCVICRINVVFRAHHITFSKGIVEIKRATIIENKGRLLILTPSSTQRILKLSRYILFFLCLFCTANCRHSGTTQEREV